MRNNKWLIDLVVCLVMIAITLFASRWIYNVVMASNLPDWFKFFILR